MSLPRYPKYRDCGVEWLGEVPAPWEVTPLKHFVSLRSGCTPSKENPAYWDGDVPWASSKDLKQSALVDTEDHITRLAVEDGAAELVPAGSLVVVVRGMILAHSFPVTKALVPMAINQDLKALRPTARVSAEFLAWLLQGSISETMRRVDEAAHGTKVLRLEAWTSMELPIPSLAEQVPIAAFLDRETAKIDALVAEQQRLVELLKEKRKAVISHAVTRGLNPAAPLKPSGIEWLGDVPAHWETPPLYLRYEQALGKMLDQGKMTGAHPTPYLRNQDVRWDRFNGDDLPTMDIRSEEKDRFTVRRGDILMVEGRELGRCAIWAGADDVIGFQKALHRLRPRDRTEDTRFFYYTMVFVHATGAFMANQQPNEIPHLTGEELRRYRFPKPPLTEQTAIVRHLDSESAKLDALTAEAQRATVLLQERRTALISAAVTGQIDVRGLAASEVA